MYIRTRRVARRPRAIAKVLAVSKERTFLIAVSASLSFAICTSLLLRGLI